MLFFFKTLSQVLKLLNSETAPSQIAAGFCFGMIIGFSPFFTWHNLIIFLIVCLFRVNFSAFFLSTALCSILGFFLDPLFDGFGYFLLVKIEALRPLWITVSSAPILPFFRFNNTVVTGSLGLALFLFIPLFIVLIVMIKAYRKSWRGKIKQSKWMKALKATKLYGLYQKYENFRAKWERLA